MLPVTGAESSRWRKNPQFAWKVIWIFVSVLLAGSGVSVERERERGNAKTEHIFSFSARSHFISIISGTQLSYYSYLHAKIDYNLLRLITPSIAVVRLWENVINNPQPFFLTFVIVLSWILSIFFTLCNQKCWRDSDTHLKHYKHGQSNLSSWTVHIPLSPQE